MPESSAVRFATATMWVLVSLLTACTTLSPVAADPTGEHIRAEVKVGDTVRVLAADGTTHSVRVSTVGESSLSGSIVKAGNGGKEAAGSPIELPYRDIREIEVERVSGLRTTAIVAAVAVAAAVAIASGGGSHTPGYSR